MSNPIAVLLMPPRNATVGATDEELRVARAMAASIGDDFDNPQSILRGSLRINYPSEQYWRDEWLNYARAAITELRK